MGSGIKTDNRSLRAKQELRRFLLKEMGLSPLRILDLCAGEGHVWRKLREELPTETYTPVDQASRQPGQIRFKIDGRFIRGLNLSRYNVIDLDTYGEPWDPWQTIAAGITQPTAVFLTRGLVGGLGGTAISKACCAALGIPTNWPVPRKRELAAFGDRYNLLRAPVCIKSAYSVQLQNVTYYALNCVALS